MRVFVRECGAKISLVVRDQSEGLVSVRVSHREHPVVPAYDSNSEALSLARSPRQKGGGFCVIGASRQEMAPPLQKDRKYTRNFIAALT